MKKFILGAVVGLAVYKTAASANLFKRASKRFGDIVLDKLIERAVKNGVTDEEMSEFVRIVSKAAQ